MSGTSGHTHRAPLLIQTCEDTTDRQPSVNREMDPHQTPSAGDLIMNFSVYRTVKIKFLPFTSHPTYSSMNGARQTPTTMKKYRVLLLKSRITSYYYKIPLKEQKDKQQSERSNL